MPNDAAPSPNHDAAKNQFGTFGGVFTPCTLTILGVIMFMRANFVLGQAGIAGALLILVLAKSITLLTTLSASAVATNMQVRGGGAYYLVSRVLGPEFGGAIGIALFIAQAASVPFYLLGFTEAIIDTFPLLEPHFLWIASISAGALLVVAYVGAQWGIKLQYVILGILLVGVVGFLGGAAIRFSPETFRANLFSAYTPMSEALPNGPRYSFWVMFAIYFPAVTGIMAGINLSGDLKDPSRSIPRGTLVSIGFTFLVYAAAIVLCGGAFDRESLIQRPFLTLSENSLFGGGFVAAGMFCAAISSALGSFMGAPRVLQAVSRDRIVRILRPFAWGSRKGDEPRPAVLLTAAITFSVIGWANAAGGRAALNLVAGAITMFFLYTYGMLNLAAFIEAAAGNPSFRPRFKVFHWSTALLGAVGCIATALIISPVQAAAAFAILGLLIWFIKSRELQTAFGDARDGFYYSSIRNNMMRLADRPIHSKNWRPTCLVFAGNPNAREALANYGLWFGAGRGIVYLTNILTGKLEDVLARRDGALKQLRNFCEERNLPAFPVVVAAENVRSGVTTVLQATAVGPIRPNLAMFGWTNDPETAGDTIETYRVAQQLNISTLILKTADSSGPRPRRVDVWWRGHQNGGLMVLLAHLLMRNWEWRNAHIRLVRLIPSESGRTPTMEALQELIHHARVDAVPHVVVSEAPFGSVLRRESGDADCVLIGFELPEPEHEQAWYTRYAKWLDGLPTTVLVGSAGEEDIRA